MGLSKLCINNQSAFNSLPSHSHPKFICIKKMFGKKCKKPKTTTHLTAKGNSHDNEFD